MFFGIKDVLVTWVAM